MFSTAAAADSGDGRSDAPQLPGAGLLVGGAPVGRPVLNTATSAHLVGIGGAGMSAIARIMLARGMAVSGSDAKSSSAVQALRSLGARVAIGHSASNVAGAQVVVVSSAIDPDNPELLAAQEAGVPVVLRAQALASLMADSVRVAVAGTHGKTTTTSMLAVAARGCGADPSFAIGGDVQQLGTNAHAGQGELFVVEADESDGSFLAYRPHLAVITNVEADHLDHYADEAAVEQAFYEFTQTIEPDGVLVFCADDPGAARVGRLAAEAGIRTRSYGLSAGADLQVVDLFAGEGVMSYTPVLDGVAGAPVSVAVAGAHLALNSAAVLLSIIECGLDLASAGAALSTFAGVGRRMELKGTERGVRVYDDYAHHPTEVAAQLLAARHAAGAGRVLVVFQSHRYSRTVAFADQFGQALALADRVIVIDTYGAGEQAMLGGGGADVEKAVHRAGGRAMYTDARTAPEMIAHWAVEGDLVLTMGAGDVTHVGPAILSALRKV